MKTIITTIAVFLTITAKSQSDSLTYKIMPGEIVREYESLILKDSSYLISDTIPVLLLFSDTAIYNTKAFWGKGFLVTQAYIKYGLQLNPQNYTYTFLGSNKQPIRKSVVVWQYKNLTTISR